MVEKYVNVHCGAKYIEALRSLLAPGALRLARVAYFEGDVEDTEKWWRILESKWASLSDVVILDFAVSVRDIPDAKPQLDIHSSDAVLAGLMASPLTRLLLGVHIPQVFGGNYLLSGQAHGRFLQLLETSTHEESLVEAHLLPTALSATPSLSIESLYVGEKIHLPAAREHLLSTEEKFIKWTADLFGSVRRVSVRPPLGAGGAPTVPRGNVSIQRPPHDERRRLGLDVARNIELCEGVFEKALKDTGVDIWARLGKVLSSDDHDGAKEVLRRLKKDEWVATVLAFYADLPENSEAVRDEWLFALRAAFFGYLLIAWMAEESGGDVVKVEWEAGELSRAMAKRIRDARIE
jgi:hypothetical protein